MDGSGSKRSPMIIAALLAAQLASAYPITLTLNTRVAKRCAPRALRSDDLSTYDLFPVDPFRGLSVPCRRRAQLLRALHALRDGVSESLEPD